jgi:heterodisulfide reductase subunit A-like polyferredoxin
VTIPEPNLAPCVTNRPGIFVTGTASGPMDIVDSIVMAGAAAAEAVAYLHEQNPVAIELTTAYAD